MGMMEIWTWLKERAQRIYFQYSFCTTVLIMDPGEAVVFNTILVAVIAMVLYTSYLFLPGHALMIVHFLARLLGLTVDGDAEAATTPS